MTDYEYKTDAESGTVNADGLVDALDRIGPSPKQIADGGWAWVEDPDTGERLHAGRENM